MLAAEMYFASFFVTTFLLAILALPLSDEAHPWRIVLIASPCLLFGAVVIGLASMRFAVDAEVGYGVASGLAFASICIGVAWGMRGLVRGE